MKNFYLMLLCGMVVCSCSESNFIGDNEVALAKMNQLYEASDVNSKKFEGGGDGPKIETRADEAEIKASMDNYLMELMNRQAVEKERVSRSAGIATGLVGVLKHGSCGSYKELEITLDCEDRRPNTEASGKIGSSYVDGNGNMVFRFCLTEAYRFYPGGVLMLDHTYGRPNTNVGPYYIILRHHDTEDSGSNNTIRLGNDNPDSFYGGHTYVTKTDAVLAWGYQYPPNLWPDYPIGPASNIKYGAIVPKPRSCGWIRVDDEDKNNKNWMKLYEGTNFKRNLTGDYDAATEYGIIGGGNTEYYIGLSTESNFFQIRH